MTTKSEEIRNIAKDLSQAMAKKLRPKKVVLFGSAARGTATRDSDMDLIVVLDTKLRPVDRVGLVLPYFDSFKGAVDLFVMTPDEWEKWSETPTSKNRSVLEEGVVLYECESISFRPG